MYDGLGEIVRGFTKNGVRRLRPQLRRRMAIFLVLGFVLHVLPFALALTGDVSASPSVAVLTLTRVILFAALALPPRQRRSSAIR